MKVWILLTLVSSACSQWANPLPAPQKLSWKDDFPIIISPYLTLSQNSSDIIQSGFNQFRTVILSTQWVPATHENIDDDTQSLPEVLNVDREISQVQIYVDNDNAELQAGVDESYQATIAEGSIMIMAPTQWGVLNAFTTIQQMVFFNTKYGKYYVEGSFEITDFPLYQHRGLMIDSGRNFLEVDDIKQQISILSMNKMNVLHWHIYDTQSWPIEIKSFPSMTNDAYSPLEVYSQKDITDIVEYAYSRGVRVIVEMDLPGHSNAGWKSVSTDLVVCGESQWQQTAVEPGPGQLDVLNDKTYTTVGTVYNEITSLLKDNYVHVGFDELKKSCYETSSAIKAWFDQSQYTMKDLASYWVSKAWPIFLNTPKRKLIVWEDAILSADAAASNVPTKNTIIQLWGAQVENVKKVTSQGYDVIISNSDFLYLDCGDGGFVTNDPQYVEVPKNNNFNKGNGGSWCAPYKTWQRIYSFDFAKNLTSDEKEHVLGAEVALWSEQVDSDIMSYKIWPRTSALAESLWSGNRDDTGMIRTTKMTSRILNFREFLKACGFKTSPLVPKMCLLKPHACDVNTDQDIFKGYS